VSVARAWIGTSGFSYKEWRGSFYPEKMSDKEFLAYYATRLPSVEIDRTFYRMPNAATVDGWAERTPEAFRFAIKASQKITHFERLRLPSEALDYLVGIVARMEQRLGVLLFQLPPNLKRDDARLIAFLEALPPGLPRAFEFRNVSWFTDEVYEILRKGGAGLCIHDADEGPTPLVTTAGLVYIRLRGSEYPKERLDEWRERIRAYVAEGLEVFCYVKHEDNPDAPRLALELAEGLV